MRKQFLFVDQRGGDCYFKYAGNCDMAQGSKGSLLLWQYTRSSQYQMLGVSRFGIVADSANRASQYQGVGLWYVGSGRETPTVGEAFGGGNRWELAVYTWDFTPPSGQGILTSYVDGTQRSRLTNASGMRVTPDKLGIGQTTSGEIGPYPTYLQAIAIWNDVMTPEQVAALWEQGHRYAISEADGTGQLTFLADFNGRYDAVVANGDATFYSDGPADRYCLLDDGLREMGRKTFAFGAPRHDLSEGDRVPIQAAGVLAERANIPFVGLTNQSDYSEVTITANDGRNPQVLCGLHAPDGPAAPAVEAGAPGCSLRAPMTLRQWVQAPRETNPFKGWVRIGPVDYLNAGNGQGLYSGLYGSGHLASVVADGGNTATQFRTSVAPISGTYPDGYWNDALLLFTTGANAGCCLKVAGWSQAMQTVTMEGPFPTAPAAGDVFVVDHGARLSGVSNTSGQRQPNENMEATLWETDGGAYVFTQLEWIWGETTWLRYDGGRFAPMQGIAQRLGPTTVGYGQMGSVAGTEYFSNVRVRRMDIDGPADYQLVRRRSGGEGPSLCDNFMVMHDSPTGDAGLQGLKRSVKTWRANGVAYRTNQPTKITDWQAARDDLTASGTWRHTAGTPQFVEWDEATQSVVCAVVGTDQAGVARLGYLRGTWSETTGRIAWTEDQPPWGRHNPIGTLDELVPPEVPERPYQIAGIVKAPDGTWSLFLNALQANFDHYVNLALHGAKDRWAFTSEYCAQDNPTPPLGGGVDSLSLFGGASGSICANRDAEFAFVENPYAQNPARRYLGYGRGKTMHHEPGIYTNDIRPLVGVMGADPRSLRGMPNGTALQPLAGPQVHSAICAMLGQEDCIAVLSDTAGQFTSGVGMWVSEDGVHFQQFFRTGATPQNALIPQGILAGEAHRLYPGSVFRLGDRRIYYYYGAGFLNFAWIRWNGESNYELDTAKTAGRLETSALERPAAGWRSLSVNVASGGGAVKVEVLDASTELPLAGYRSGDCDAIGDGVATRVTWRGADLSEATADTIRLRISLTRPSVSAASPAIYDWRIEATAAAVAPSVASLQVNGKVNPAGISDNTPKLSWQYASADGSPQAAYRVIVASSQENLDGNFGDLWDTGDVMSSETSAAYGGAPLKSGSTYFWKVRVRNAKGVWSETW